LGSFSHMCACRSSSENTRKMSLIPVFNKNSPWAHIRFKIIPFTLLMIKLPSFVD
jgi:hypothetical protein